MLKRAVKEVNEFVKLEDGVHEGTILEVTETVSKSGFDVIQLKISIEDTGKDGDYVYTFMDSEGTPQLISVLTSFNDNVSSKSDLGKFLKRMGFEVTPDSEIDLEDIVGRKVKFQTITSEKEYEGETRSFTNVVRESLTPQ